MAKTPTSFNDLDAAELYRSAIEDFALPVEEDEKGKKKVLLSAFVEGGVTWDDYLVQHPEFAPTKEEAALAAGSVITSGAPLHNSVHDPVETGLVTVASEDVAVVAPVDVVVASPAVVSPNSKYLIKMTRENPLFEVRGHKFTSTHPYALVAAEDAEYILENEDGFRQAFPSELAEFYG